MDHRKEKGISCEIENSVLNEPYPIDQSHIDKMVLMGLWAKM
jgi:hypothetical protein